ncbi:hypothetical protein ACWDUL_39430 [Nocardia niigatensis]
MGVYPDRRPAPSPQVRALGSADPRGPAEVGQALRQDIARLRDLGYPAHAARGPVGGYRLGQGSTMPPLLLGDDMAVAVAVAMGVAADGSTDIADIHANLEGAQPKLDRVLPKRLQRKVTALRSVTTPPRPNRRRDRDCPFATASRAELQPVFGYENNWLAGDSGDGLEDAIVGRHGEPVMLCRCRDE